MTKPILVAVDESEGAAAVLEAAITLARTFSASLIICRVVAMPTVPLTAEGLPVGLDLQTEIERKAKSDLERIVHKVPSDIATKLVTLLDVPWQGICEAATQEDAGTIVIGSHAYGGLDRILGTTAAKVVNHADRSVLVVRGAFPG